MEKVLKNQRGATMASSVDPLFGNQTSPLAILLQQTLIVIIATSYHF